MLPTAHVAALLPGLTPPALHRTHRDCNPYPTRTLIPHPEPPAPGAAPGAMYWRLGNDTSSGTYDRAASIWFAALCVIFQSGNNACTIFYSQKPLLRREISSGLYHYSAFYVAKGLTSLPFQLAYAVIFNATVYFLARPAGPCRPPARPAAVEQPDGRCLFLPLHLFWYACMHACAHTRYTIVWCAALHRATPTLHAASFRAAFDAAMYSMRMPCTCDC